MTGDNPAQGHCYWITGLPGSGKSHIGKALATALRKRGEAVVYLDGDTLREVFGQTDAHTLEQRRDLSYRYGRLCRMLMAQKLTVVCSVVAMFHQVRAWNRQHIPAYVEVFLDVPMAVLIERDQKGLYSGALQGRVTQVIGFDLPFEAPQTPDVVLSNHGGQTVADGVVSILEQSEATA